MKKLNRIDLEICKLTALGKSSEQIGVSLRPPCSHRKVEWHRSAIYRRLKLTNGVQSVVQYALSNHLIDLLDVGLLDGNYLSTAQKRILTLVGRGLPDKDIASSIGNINTRTVETHIDNIAKKLRPCRNKLRRRVVLIHLAVKLGLVTIEEINPDKTVEDDTAL